MEINDLISFMRFSLNASPHIKTSGPINRLSLFSHCRSIDRIFPCNFLIPQTLNFAVSLTLKLELALNVTYYPPPPLLQKQAIKLYCDELFCIMNHGDTSNPFCQSMGL